MSMPDRKAKLDKSHATLSVRSQCKMLNLTRSGVYRAPKAANSNSNDLAVMRKVDELFTRWPFTSVPGSLPRSINVMSVGPATSMTACMRDARSSSTRRWLRGSLPTFTMS